MVTAPTAATPWASGVRHLRDALVAPPQENRMVQRGGVYDAAGKYLHMGSMWRGATQTLVPDREKPQPKSHLPGRWIWGGVLYHHFGHFLMESMSRLWALHDMTDPIDGILWASKSPWASRDLKGYQRQLLDLYGFQGNTLITSQPITVEELYLPGPGIGIGDISCGTEKFRTSMQQHFAADIAPKGEKSIYVSRCGLGPLGSGTLGEAFIETMLERHGYRVIRPESMSIPDQIAAYKACDKAVFADGSAAHLFAMVARPQQKTALILRRRHWNQPILNHLSGFTGERPTVIDAVRHIYSMPDVAEFKFNYWATLDFAKVGAALAQAGFIANDSGWDKSDCATMDDLNAVATAGPIVALDPDNVKSY